MATESRLSDSDTRSIAASLHQARLSAKPVGLVTQTYPELTWDSARAIARCTDELRRTDGETQIGWKLGWTSTVMREALGVNRPNWGTLWDTQQIGFELELDRFIHPKLEPELVWQAKDDLPAGASVNEVREAGGGWALGIEVVDPRFPSFDFDALDNTADNSSSGAVRVGQFITLDAEPSEQCIVLANGVESREGFGSEAMGDPVQAVAWLAQSLAKEGSMVKAGDIVFTGGLTAPFDVERGATYKLESDLLGAVTLAIV